MRFITVTGRRRRSQKYSYTGKVYVLPEGYEPSHKRGQRPFEIGTELYKAHDAERQEWVDTRSNSGKHGSLKAVAAYDLPDETRLFYSFVEWRNGYPGDKCEGEYAGEKIEAFGFAIGPGVDFEFTEKREGWGGTYKLNVIEA